MNSQLYAALSDISHPLEGTFYLFLLAMIFRWIWPQSWNNFLRSISASVEKDLTQTGEPKGMSSNKRIKNKDINQLNSSQAP